MEQGHATCHSDVTLFVTGFKGTLKCDAYLLFRMHVHECVGGPASAYENVPFAVWMLHVCECACVR